MRKPQWESQSLGSVNVQIQILQGQARTRRDAVDKLVCSHVRQVLGETGGLMELEHFLGSVVSQDLPRCAGRSAKALVGRSCGLLQQASVRLATRVMPESTSASCIMALPVSMRRTNRAASSTVAT